MTDLHPRAKSTVRSSLFLGIKDEDVEAILAAASRKRIPAGRVVIEAGEKADRMFLLGVGRAKYYRLTKLGDEVLLWSLLSGDTFGLGTLLRQPTRYIGTARVNDFETGVREIY